MHDKRDDYEPIIATRRAPKPEREDTRPLWPSMLALGGGVVVVVLLAWWFMGRSSTDDESTAQSEVSAPETFPEIRVEDEPLPSARDPGPSTDAAKDSTPPAQDSGTASDVAQPPASPPAAEEAAGAGQAAVPESAPAVTPESAPAATSESAPAAVPGNAAQVPVAPTSVEVRLVSPDAQVRFELRSQLDSNPSLTGKAGDVVNVTPGTYRVVASGAQLEPLEREVTFDAGGPQEYTVELCAQPKQERENLAGRVVEERACASAAQCESMFMVLGEEAEQLVKDRDFRTQQCAKWRANASPEGTWTLATECDGATAASTCRIQITAGACTFAEPARTVRGTACPQAELR